MLEFFNSINCNYVLEFSFRLANIFLIVLLYFILKGRQQTQLNELEKEVLRLLAELKRGNKSP